MELTNEQQKIVEAIVMLNDSCTIYMGRRTGKSVIVSHLSQKYNCPVLVQTIRRKKQLIFDNNINEYMILLPNDNMEGHMYNILIIDEIFEFNITNLDFFHLQNRVSKIIGFTSTINPDWPQLINVDQFNKYESFPIKSPLINGYIIKPGKIEKPQSGVTNMIKRSHGVDIFYDCEECHYSVSSYYPIHEINFCPRCGRKIIGV